MLPQPVPVNGAPLSQSDQVHLAARAQNTQRAYLGHWTRFRSWAQEQGLGRPRAWRPLSATTWSAWRRTANAWPPSGRPGRPSSRAPIWRGGPDPGAPETGGTPPRRGLGGNQGTAFTPRRTRAVIPRRRNTPWRRGLVDVALRWGDVELAGDSCGRIRIPESKTDQEAEGVVLYLGPAAAEALLAIRPEEAVIDAVTPVFNLHPDTTRRRLQQAARAAGLPGWRDITGHSGRVGMAQDLSSAGFALPELMTAGRWKSPRMPARYTERQAAGRGAVARYYQDARG